MAMKIPANNSLIGPALLAKVTIICASLQYKTDLLMVDAEKVTEISEECQNLALFENFISNPWLWEASIILFLTNTDLFQDKIQRSDLATHFPEYEGLFSPCKLLWFCND